MGSDKKAEIFLFEDNFFITSSVSIRRVDEDKIVFGITPLLNKHAMLGKKIYIKYATFVLPTKVIGKTQGELILSMPMLNPEKPVGDRKSARVYPSDAHPVKVYISLEGEKEKEYELSDISEGGFAIKIENPAEAERFIGKEVKVRLDFPVEGEEVTGKAKLVNIQEFEGKGANVGFELLIEDADAVKVRFYVYSRIKEILKRK